jgi:hypothetical protein
MKNKLRLQIFVTVLTLFTWASAEAGSCIASLQNCTNAAIDIPSQMAGAQATGSSVGCFQVVESLRNSCDETMEVAAMFFVSGNLTATQVLIPKRTVATSPAPAPAPSPAVTCSLGANTYSVGARVTAYKAAIVYEPSYCQSQSIVCGSTGQWNMTGYTSLKCVERCRGVCR